MREVSSDDHLEGEEEEKRLNAVEASVDEVSHEQVIGVRHISANLDEKQMWASLLFPVRKTIPSYLEEFSEIVELAVDVSAHSHWRVNPLYVALFHWNQMCLLIQESVFDDSINKTQFNSWKLCCKRFVEDHYSYPESPLLSHRESSRRSPWSPHTSSTALSADQGHLCLPYWLSIISELVKPSNTCYSIIFDT